MSGSNARSRTSQGLARLRVVVAALLAVHGVARAGLGIVDDFGTFLTASGLPLGTLAAWAVTVYEIAGGLLLALGRWVRPLASLFCLALLAGIALVHWPAGWFVVGAGRNGLEYSVLLVAVLAVLAWTDESRAEPEA